MPFPNRVDPFGTIQANPARGLFTGNRGVIHDPGRKRLLSRRWTTKAWLICACDFKGRRREVMGRNAPSGGAGWTELFFLDEVTALAAGHRPCFFCRRDSAKTFARAFAAGRDRQAVSAPEMDAILHSERFAATGQLQPLLEAPETLPDGAMVALDGTVYAVREGRLLRWSFEGYSPCDAPAGCPALLTPAAAVATLAAGFRPVWHGSASATAGSLSRRQGEMPAGRGVLPTSRPP